MKTKMDKLTGLSSKLAKYALYSKNYYLKHGTHYTHKVWDTLVFKKI